MTKWKDQMKLIQSELADVQAQIQELKVKENVLLDLIAKLNGDDAGPVPTRKRAANVKPLVLDIMREAGMMGATTAEVDSLVRQRVPNVAKDTVGSLLSRLKSAGALAHDGERYYEKQFAPKPPSSPFEGLRAVS